MCLKYGICLLITIWMTRYQTWKKDLDVQTYSCAQKKCRLKQ